MSGVGSSYDAVPYQSHPFAQSQPDRLAVVARLFGLHPTVPRRANVLELGCAAGGNLIPLAARYPDAHFFGIDYSAVQVSTAQREIAMLGLANIRIEQGDITNFSVAETFDYVICHGVYSWVPESTRVAILRICRAVLTEQGVAYVSYNTYPGWRLREVVREAMLFHAGAHGDARQRLAQGRAFLQFMQQTSDPASIFGQLLKIESAMIANYRDDYVLHDHLEQNNTPCYFKDFMVQADAQGLAYLGEANFIEMLPQHLGVDVQRTLEQISGGNIILTEQYMDFIRNRYFRQTLLVKRERIGDIQRNIRADQLAMFHLSANIKTQRDVNVTASTVATFDSAQGRSMDVTEPIVKAALVNLGGRFPRTVTFDELLRAASALASVSGGAQRDTLLNALLALAVNGLLELHAEPVVFAGANQSRPRAFSVARQHGLAGHQVVTNCRHEEVTVNVFQGALLGLLDGDQDSTALVAALTARCLAGELNLLQDQKPITSREGLEALMPGVIAENLRLLEAASLLI